MSGQIDEAEVARIAKGLTKAQREAVLGARAMFGTLSLHGAPSTLHSLKRKGITGGPFADRFTDPLGLAVCKHLEADNAG